MNFPDPRPIQRDTPRPEQRDTPRPEQRDTPRPEQRDTPRPIQRDTPHQPHFAHPAEEIFAKILDFYGIEWEYEPRTFPLEWDEQGRVTEAFSPDFYLPAQSLFIELTTLRTKLATFKNRRIRRMQELYPEIHIKLIKRREMRDMMEKYGLYESAGLIRGDVAQHPGVPHEDKQ